jgi:hypothetical protein
MFGIVVLVSLLWAKMIDKTKKEDYKDVDFP